jgi:anaerobic nitric oxide reductase flavorubredoxin
MAVTIKNDIKWVGKVDWEIRKFHGEEYSTHRGTTYNSYLIEGEKNVLIDTVWEPFGDEFVAELEKEIDIEKIDCIVANHAEIDHSGGLPALMERIPGAPIYCTENGVKSISGHYHKDWNFMPVKTGDSIKIGDRGLTFVEAKMLHWPDSMFCYLSGDNVLFSNDAFGQHYATERLYNDLVDQCELYQEAIKYYANILTPFSSLVEKKINQLLGMELQVDMICPSHGVIWRKSPLDIVDKYLEWSRGYKTDQITIIYDTMWNGTRKMAEAIADGIKDSDSKVNIKLYNSARADKNTILTEVFRSKAVLVGSPTINKGVLASTAGILEHMKGLRFEKKGAAFGCYGWSGESVDVISTRLKEAGIELLDDGLKVLWDPDGEALEQCMEFGRSIAAFTRISDD